MKQRFLACVLILAAGIWHAAPARADLIDFALTTPAQTGLPGEMLAFIGTISNPGASDVFLNGTLSISPVGLTLDEDPFFDNTPLFLPPGGSFTGELFDIDIGTNVVPATYLGSFAILGGADADAFGKLATVQFSIGVGGIQSVAEPNATLLFATALAISLIQLRWRTAGTPKRVARQFC